MVNAVRPLCCAGLSLLVTLALLPGTIAESSQPEAITQHVELALPRHVFPGLPCVSVIRATNMSTFEGPSSMAEWTLLSKEKMIETSNRLRLERFDFPTFDMLRSNLPLYVAISDAGTNGVVRIISPRVDAFHSLHTDDEGFHHYYPTTGIRRGETRLLVADLGPSFASLPDGEYMVGVGVCTSKEHRLGWLSAQEKACVGGAEQSVLELLYERPVTSNDSALVKTPEEWLDFCTKHTDLDKRLPRDVFTQLAPYCFLGKVCRDGKISEAPLAMLDMFPSHLAGFADMLRYEVLLAKDKAAAEKFKAELGHESESLKWDLQQADKGAGFIKRCVDRCSP